MPHCLYDAALTTALWVERPRDAPDLPRERGMADAVAAGVPGEALWRRYNEKIAALTARGELADGEIQFLRYSDAARSLLMDQTRGSDTGVTDLTVPQLLELYQENVARDARDALSAERERHAETQQALRSERELGREQEMRVVSIAANWNARLEHLSDKSGRYAAHTAVGVLFLLLVAGMILGPVGPVDAWLCRSPSSLVVAASQSCSASGRLRAVDLSSTFISGAAGRFSR